MARKLGTLYILCAKCGSFSVPQKKDESTTPRCWKCRSRQTTKATAEEIGDHFRDNIERRVWDNLREKLGLSSDTAPDEIVEELRKKALGGMPKPGGWDICPVCGTRPGCVCQWCGAGFGNYKARTRHVREEHPEEVKQPGGQRKKRPEDPSLEESKEPSIITEARDRHLGTAEERRRARERAADDDSGKGASKHAGRKISADTEQPIHKRIGIKADKLERIVADFDRAENRSGLDEHGIPLISEEHNVHWIEIVGRVGWNKAHRIFHEVLMKGVECTLPIGYKPLE